MKYLLLTLLTAVSISLRAQTFPIDTIKSKAAVISGQTVTALLCGTLNAIQLNPSTGAGTTPSYTARGTSLGGYISLTTGTTPTASAAVFSIQFPAAYTTYTYVTLTPGNAATAALTGTSAVYVTTTTTGFNLFSGSTALTASTTYIWYYTANGF